MVRGFAVRGPLPTADLPTQPTRGPRPTDAAGPPTADPADCPLLNTASCDVERDGRISTRKSLKLLANDGTALGHDRGVDRPLPPGVETPAAPAARAENRRPDRARCRGARGAARVDSSHPHARPHPHRAASPPARSKRSSWPPARSCPKSSACSRARSTRACCGSCSGRAPTSKQGDPVVELDTSESVLALDKVVKDLKIKENQQAQTRLTLEKSLVDLDGRIEVKALELQSAQARLDARSAAVQGGPALARVAAPLRARGQAGADRAGAAPRRSGPTPSAPTSVQLEGLVARARLARQGSGAGAAAARPVDDEVGSRRRADVGAVAGRRAGPARRRHRAHRRPDLVPRRRHRLRRPRRPAAHRHAGGRPGQRRSICRAPSPRSSRPSRTACCASPSRSPSRRTPACGRACAPTSWSSPTASRATLRVKRGPVRRQRRAVRPSWSAAIAPSACRSCSASPASTTSRCVSGVERRRRDHHLGHEGLHAPRVRSRLR